MLAVTIFCGCQTAAYYSQAIRGELEVLARRQPIPELVRDPATTPEMRAKFEQVLAIREFARTNLHLPVKAHYLKYTDLPRRYAVWNVCATPEFSLDPKSWWYPIVGSQSYRGYFNEAAANEYAASLKAKGYEVFVGGVEAYSTLGWFEDPVLSTFIRRDAADLAEILFHELSHQRLFFKGDTDFNEAFATAVADEGVRRWMAARGNLTAIAEHETARRREQEFVAMLNRAMDRLDALYIAAGTADKQPGEVTATETLREARAKIIADLRQDYAQLKQQWGGYDGYDRWMGLPLNNAQLSTVATYHDLVPLFQKLLAKCGGDLEKFYHEVDRLKKLGKDERRARLKE